MAFPTIKLSPSIGIGGLLTGTIAIVTYLSAHVVTEGQYKGDRKSDSLTHVEEIHEINRKLDGLVAGQLRSDSTERLRDSLMFACVLKPVRCRP